jgi:hypothetical protein
MGASFSYAIIALHDYNNKIINKNGYKLIKDNNILFELDKFELDKFEMQKNKKNKNEIND